MRTGKVRWRGKENEANEKERRIECNNNNSSSSSKRAEQQSIFLSLSLYCDGEWERRWGVGGERVAAINDEVGSFLFLSLSLFSEGRFGVLS